MIKSSSIILIFIVLTSWLVYLFPGEAISPGDLLEKHGHLEESCSNCHVTFKGAQSEKCAQCHIPEKIGVFKANSQIINQGKKRLSFHAKLNADSCISCHKEHQGRFTLRQTVRFSHEMLGINDTKSCMECHQKPTNSIHQQASQNCGRCHNPTNWASVDIDHNTYFQFDRDHQTDCSTCHPGSNYRKYTCYGCHEHSPRKIEREHVKEGIHDYENCAECHRSGDEHDIRKPRKVKNRDIRFTDKETKRHDRKSKHSSDRSHKSKKHLDDDNGYEQDEH